jgi:hypothetical protein
MPLNELTLDQLTRLADDLKALETVGRDLAPLDPIFDLTPGQPTRITLVNVMPAAFGQLAETPSTEAAPDQTGAVAPEPPEPVETPPAVKGPAGGEPQPSALVSSTVSEAVTEAEDSDGGQQQAAASPPVAPVAKISGLAASIKAAPSLPAAGNSPTINHERTFSGAAIWTEEEDARLVMLVVMGVTRLGLTKSAAIKAAADELGRPHPGTHFRSNHKLKARIDEALALGDAFLDEPEDLPTTPEPNTAEGDTQAAIQAEPAKAWHKPEHIADPVTAHLMALPDKGGWTLDRDLELMELSIAGWAPNEIALQLTMQANMIKPRFDALTGLYTDANDKKQRRFSREAVFEALKSLAAKA